MTTSSIAATPYLIAPYQFETLLDWLADATVDRDVASFKERGNIAYLRNYLREIGARTMIQETEYVDSDYMNDYAAYYAKCFRQYSKFTRRIHFFARDIDAAQFAAALTDTGAELHRALREQPEQYLGFIVVKPLPRTLIGKTCLAPYPTDNGQRHYPILRPYRVNLFGLELRVDSLAFQEQDQEVAACATSALWSMFHGSAARFGHGVPSPHSITLAGTANIPDWYNATPDTRRFPNSGLSPAQISAAIRSLDLEAFLVGCLGKSKAGQAAPQVSRRAIANIAAYAYLSSGIPVLMFCKLTELKKDGQTEDIAFHAVTLTGFSTDTAGEPKAVIREGKSEITLRPMRIRSFYAHDDQIGPFAKMSWRDDDTLTTSWHDGDQRQVIAKPDSLIVPLAAKIRIPYDIVETAIVEINQLISLYVKQRTRKAPEWEIRLDSVTRLKAEIIADDRIEPPERQRLLTRHMPRHIWRAIARIDHAQGKNWPELEFLIDATALQQEGGLIDVIMRGSSHFLAGGIVASLHQPVVASAAGKHTLSPLARQICRYFESPDAADDTTPATQSALAMAAAPEHKPPSGPA